MELMFLESLYKEKIWGREKWLVSAHPHGETTVTTGKYQGQKLSEAYPEFPLLVKIIEADDDLSIQVHPDDEYAKRENSKGKTECWYVLEAKEDAGLIIGHNAKDKEEFCRMVKNGEWDALLREVKVKKGDFFQIEPGDIHAVKGGVKLLEIQQSSDITYRLYDYDRLQSGVKRELHIKECIETVKCPYETKNNDKRGNELISCPFYTVEKISVSGNTELCERQQLVVVTCIEGCGFADGKAVGCGESFIIPKGHKARLNGDMELILAYEKRENVRVGIDLGGTNIAVGLVDKFGRLFEKATIPTQRERGIDAICDDMTALCLMLLKKNNLEIEDVFSIGIGCPGTIDTENGIVVYSNNIPMENVPLGSMMKERLKRSVKIENDANAAAYGEYTVNFKDAESFILITLGTGVGSGFVNMGKIYRGFNYAGFECGHITIHPNGKECTCGNKGCLEAYASASALENRGKDRCENIFNRTLQGDEDAQKVLDEYIEDLALGIGSVINIIQPRVLAIGGGLSNAGDMLLNPLREHVKKKDFNKYMKKTEIVTAKLLNDAGIIGAAML